MQANPKDPLYAAPARKGDEKGSKRKSELGNENFSTTE